MFNTFARDFSTLLYKPTKHSLRDPDAIALKYGRPQALSQKDNQAWAWLAKKNLLNEKLKRKKGVA